LHGGCGSCNGQLAIVAGGKRKSGGGVEIGVKIGIIFDKDK
jgi:hypothetical protein